MFQKKKEFEAIGDDDLNDYDEEEKVSTIDTSYGVSDQV